MLFPQLKVITQLKNFLKLPQHASANLYIISVQHLLETTGSLFEAIIDAGFLPQNIYLTGKIYSTHQATSDRLRSLGVHVIPSSVPVKLGCYIEELEKDITGMWALLNMRLTGASRVIILDDGGYTLKNVPDTVSKKCRVFGIEQTTSGIRMQSAFGKFPVIHLAASAAKVLIEPPIVSEAVQIQVGNSIRKLNPKTIGIVGYGHIGKAVAREFAPDYTILVYDLNDEIDNDLVPGAIRCGSLSELYSRAELIIGATGQDISDLTWLTRSMADKTLMSVSSGDIEFNTLLRNCEPYLNEELKSPLQILNLITQNGYRLKILRGGMVANFTGTADSSPGHIIQVTRGLLFSAVLQILRDHARLENQFGPIMLDPELQSKVVLSWFDDQPQRKMDYSQEILEGFQNPDWIKTHSAGVFIQ